MAKKTKLNLVDYVEAAERREAPRAQARATGRGAWSSIWVGLIVLTIVLTAGAVVFLRMRRLI
ncbi:MAG: hypothetical protein IT555_10615 [Acetobacteraceae bacterium]|nr:hypothetical protein [Acetobacteraceae bacterium]